MAADINIAALTGRLTRDPELRHTGGGTPVAGLRLAFTSRRKQGDNWIDESNFIDVVIWGKQGEMACEHLSKGRQIGVSGRLHFREWEHEDRKLSKIELIADDVRYLGSKPNGDNSASGSDGDDDIPF